MIQQSLPWQLFMLMASILAVAVAGLLLIGRAEPELDKLLVILDLLLCGVFFVDFLVQLFTAHSKWRYMHTWGWIDLLTCVPALESFRLARAAKIFRIVRILRLIRGVRSAIAVLSRLRTQSVAATAAGVLLLSLCLGSLFVLYFEQASPDAQITSAGDAFWWAFVTITTVGYGDAYPVTTGGRIVAVILMATGVGLFGALSALLATWLIRQSDPDDRNVLLEMQSLRSEIAELATMLSTRETNQHQAHED